MERVSSRIQTRPVSSHIPPPPASSHIPPRPGAKLQGVELDRLIQRWQRHADERAREELVKAFLPLARAIARRYQGAWEPVEDLEQVASLALLKAIDRFDPSRGSSFQSFAAPTIAGELKRYFRDLGWAVHVTRGAKERALKVEEANRKLFAQTGRSPTVAQLAVYLELSIDDVIDALEAGAAHHTASLDAPQDDGEGGSCTLGDAIGHEDDRFEVVDARVSISRAVRSLDRRDREVLSMRLVDDRTQSDIADEIGVSQMQVSRILRRSVERVQELVLTEADEDNPERAADKRGARSRRRPGGRGSASNPS